MKNRRTSNSRPAPRRDHARNLERYCTSADWPLWTELPTNWMGADDIDAGWSA